MSIPGRIRCLAILICGFACLYVGGFAATVANAMPYDTDLFNRSNFPEGFIFGTASSAYQDGKGSSIWDTFTHKYPGKITDGSNGDVAIDQYHRYKGDVEIMKNMGLDAYRFSISWPRILPKGHLRGGVNQKGIGYYNNLIDALLANGIQPYVTLFHWDLPQTLQDEYGGFSSADVVDDYKDFAELCFNEFGDRVKHWITLNEPYMYTIAGYTVELFEPSRCPAGQNMNCTASDLGTEPYLVGHNLILAHATAVELYKEKHQASQKGIIGVSLNSNWMVPYSNSKRDEQAARRALDFMFGWFLHPITYGDYPKTMREFVGKRLPEFTKDQVKLIKGSYDFIGINYYTASYAAHTALSKGPASVFTDSQTNQTSERNGIPIGPRPSSSWVYAYPQGIQQLVSYTTKNYNNPVIYITENGINDPDNNTALPLEKQLADEMRISYYHGHLQHLKQAIDNGARVKGFFAWTLLDDFEWTFGFTSRFGIHYVDYLNGLKRYPKHSAIWFTNFLKKT